MPDNDTLSLHFSFFGMPVRVDCTNEQCADDVASYFRPYAVVQPRLSPLISFRISRPEGDRALFRARHPSENGKPLPGVEFSTLREPMWRPWVSAEQPLPPFSSEYFANRYVALHAGSFLWEDSLNCVMLGDRGSGKTSLVSTFCEIGASFRGDETSLLVAGTSVSVPFAQPWSIRGRNSSDKTTVEVLKSGFEVDLEMRKVDCVLVLPSPGATPLVPEGGAALRKLKPEEAYFAVLPHVRRSGSTTEVSLATLATLVEETEVFATRHFEYETRKSFAEDALAALTAQRI